MTSSKKLIPYVLFSDDGIRSLPLLEKFQKALDQYQTSTGMISRASCVGIILPSEDRTGTGATFSPNTIRVFSVPDHPTVLLADTFPIMLPYVARALRWRYHLAIFVNDGLNLGPDFLGSGSVQGTLQAYFMGDQAVSVSFEKWEQTKLEGIATATLNLPRSRKIPGAWSINVPTGASQITFDVRIGALHRKTKLYVRGTLETKDMRIKHEDEIGEYGDVPHSDTLAHRTGLASVCQLSDLFARQVHGSFSVDIRD